MIVAHGAAAASTAAEYSLLLLAGLLYAYGWVRSGLRPAVWRLVGPRHALAASAALASLWLALCSPLDAYADTSLWVHMVQHLLIGLVAPLLWCLARPVLVYSSVLDPPQRRQVNRAVTSVQRNLRLRRTAPSVGVAAMSFHIVVWWGWHLPPAFDLALRNDLVHALEHACLFTAGLVLWWVCLGVRWSDRGGLAILYLFGAAVATGMVGALLTLDPTPIYATTVAGAHRWGLTRLGDQQLGGVIMWVIGGAIYLGVASVLATRWLSLGPGRDDGRPLRSGRPSLNDLL